MLEVNTPHFAKFQGLSGSTGHREDLYLNVVWTTGQ